MDSVVLDPALYPSPQAAGPSSYSSPGYPVSTLPSPSTSSLIAESPLTYSMGLPNVAVESNGFHQETLGGYHNPMEPYGYPQLVCGAPSLYAFPSEDLYNISPYSLSVGLPSPHGFLTGLPAPYSPHLTRSGATSISSLHPSPQTPLSALGPLDRTQDVQRITFQRNGQPYVPLREALLSTEQNPINIDGGSDVADCFLGCRNVSLKIKVITSRYELCMSPYLTNFCAFSGQVTLSTAVISRQQG